MRTSCKESEYFSKNTKKMIQILEKTQTVEVSKDCLTRYIINAMAAICDERECDYLELKEEDYQEYFRYLGEIQSKRSINRTAHILNEAERNMYQAACTEDILMDRKAPLLIYRKCMGNLQSYRKNDYMSKEYIQIADIYYLEKKSKTELNVIADLTEYAKKDFLLINQEDVAGFLKSERDKGKRRATIDTYIRIIERMGKFCEKKNENGTYKAIRINDITRHSFYHEMPSDQDLSGMKFGQLKVLKEERVKTGSGVRRKWKCRCDCKKIVYATTNELLSGRKTHCGNRKRHSSHEDLTGEIIEPFKVLGIAPKRENNRICYECECLYCGEKRTVRASQLRAHELGSCGCRRNIKRSK